MCGMLMICLLAYATPIELTAEPTRVSLFKNGYGVVTAEVALPSETEAMRITPLPEATLGSLWLSWPEDVAVGAMIAREAVVTQDVAAMNIPQLLQANLGHEADLLVHEEWITGTLHAMPQTDAVPLPRTNARIQPPPTTGQVLILKYGNVTRFIPVTSIAQVRLHLDPKLTVSQTTPTAVLDFDLTQSAADASLRMHYTAAGLSWSPSYRIDITDDTTARISAKAVIVNDLTDLNRVTVELFTGYPHLAYAHAPTPLGLMSLQDFLRSLTPSRDGRHMITSNVVMQQRAEYRPSDGFSPSMPGEPVMGESAEDLFFYQVPDVTLAQGERGYYPLFAAELPYKHVYTWRIDDFVNEDNRYRPSSEQADQPEVVWHAIRLQNTTDQPWTTAPAQTTQGHRVLGQDTLHYTPIGGTTDLKITQALAIRAEQSENEIARERNASRFHGSNYDKVTVRGELALTNHKDRPVTVDITKLLSGEVTQADQNPTVVKLGTGLRRVNPRSELSWSLRVNPGRNQTVRLSYTYEVYVRN